MSARRTVDILNFEVHQGDSMKTDAVLKKDVVDELNWDPAVVSTAIGVAVKDGVVTVSGHLDTYAQKFAVEHADVDGSTVTLHGQVHSWRERNAVQAAAWAAPGVQSVNNELRVTP
jgi:osmotically-inducible protein OsmY